ncbi:MAG: anti-sigma factor [Cocleimonas sp.]
MNSSTANTENKNKLPLWLIIFFSSVLIMVLSYLGLSFYQNSQQKTPLSHIEQLERTELEHLKESILEQSDTIDTNWLRTLNPMVKHVQGRLLWSSTKQQGVVEFINLPSLKNTQQYRLWVYDLEANDSKPITAAVFKSIDIISGIFSQAFQPKIMVKAPLKFELVLEEGDVEGFLPLLLAQP